MTTMAPMSSTIARVSRNTRTCDGRPGPMSASAPRTNAMSVAMTMPQPCAPSPPALMATYSSAGTTIPPSAASAGTAARAPVAQLAERELPADLQRDDEEEERPSARR